MNPNDRRLAVDKHNLTNGKIKTVLIDGEECVPIDEIHSWIVDTINEMPPKTTVTVQEAKDAREVVTDLLHGLGRDVENFGETCNEHLQFIRRRTNSIARETNDLLPHLKDVRSFFLSKDHETEIQRRKDFIETCERLKDLKDSGFLDDVADTILKLDSK